MEPLDQQLLLSLVVLGILVQQMELVPPLYLTVLLELVSHQMTLIFLSLILIIVLFEKLLLQHAQQLYLLGEFKVQV
jgi:hypothetical protein